MSALTGMTQAKWNSLSLAERERLADLGNLTPQLVGLEGWRVEVVTNDGEKRRFIVSRSTGWQPIHIEIKTVRSTGGHMVFGTPYRSVRKLRKVRE